MSLSRKFKQAFVRHYNPESPWLLVPIFLSGGFGAYGAGSALYESPSEKPLAPLTQQAAAHEKAVLGQHLSLIGKTYKTYTEADEALQKAEDALPQADDVTAARDTLAKLTADKLEARFRLDDQTEQFQRFALQKTHLPESTVEATVASYASQWKLPAEVTTSYTFRDEVRATFDPAGLSAHAATQKMHSLVANAASNNNFGSGALGLFSLFGGMGLSYTMLCLGGGTLRQRFYKSLRQEEWEEESRRRDLESERQVALTAAEPPAPPAPSGTVTPAPPKPEPKSGLRF